MSLPVFQDGINQVNGLVSITVFKTIESSKIHRDDDIIMAIASYMQIIMLCRVMSCCWFLCTVVIFWFINF